MQEPLSAAPCTSCARLVGLSHPIPNDPKNQTTHPGNLFGARRSILILGAPDSSGQQGDRYISKNQGQVPLKMAIWEITYHIQLVIFADFWSHHQPKRENPEKNDDFSSLRWGFPGDGSPTKMLQKMAGIPPIGLILFCETARETPENNNNIWKYIAGLKPPQP